MEPLDWLAEIDHLKWAIGSLDKLFSPGSCEKEIFKNVSRGIESRLNWILEQAKAETKRDPYHK